MKQLIIVSTILDIVELALLTVCYEFFIAQYRTYEHSINVDIKLHTSASMHARRKEYLIPASGPCCTRWTC